jgi:hypothetical protein
MCSAASRGHLCVPSSERGDTKSATRIVMFVIRAVTTYVGLALGHSGCNPDASPTLSAGILSRPLTLAHVGEPPMAGAVCCIGTHAAGTPGCVLSLAASPLPLVVTGGARRTGRWVATGHMYEAWLV